MAFSFDVLTLFPGLFAGLQQESLVAKAVGRGLITLDCHDWRGFTHDRHRTVDDAPFGGGAGMVLKPEPVIACLRHVKGARASGVHTVLLSPAGRVFEQALAQAWSQKAGLVLLCGRYEGFDARVETACDDVVSLGDFVLQGGEVAAMAIVEAVSRLLPGVVGNAASITDESHSDGLVEYPHYTRPRDFEGMAVPDVLLTGNHAEIAAWRKRQSLERTAKWRPDLLKQREPR
jgi:tRNA (guanine37-N1)-methyltransferase